MKLVVNTTPLGTFPNASEAPDLPYQFFSPLHLAYDLVYNPLHTPFLRAAAACGWNVQEGLTMLLMVAAPMLLTVLVVGLVVSVVQAATQLHEATLSFVPKLIAAVVVMAVAGPWMLTTLVEYLQRTLQAIPTVVG